MATKMTDVKIHCKHCLIFFVLILGLQSKVWMNPSFTHVSLCVKVKFRQSILDLSMIAEEGFSLRHCLLARVDWPFPSEDGRTFELSKFSMLSVHTWLLLYKMDQSVFILSFLPG